MVEALNKSQNKFTIDQLYESYPDKKMDIAAEEKLIKTEILAFLITCVYTDQCVLKHVHSIARFYYKSF